MSSHNYGTAATEAGNLPVQPYDVADNEPPSVATVVQIASSGTSAVVLAVNPLRNGAIFNNGGTTTCYLAFGATSSSTAFTALLIANANYSLPTNPIYTGAISAIWAGSPSGNLQVTQY